MEELQVESVHCDWKRCSTPGEVVYASHGFKNLLCDIHWKKFAELSLEEGLKLMKVQTRNQQSSIEFSKMLADIRANPPAPQPGTYDPVSTHFTAPLPEAGPTAHLSTPPAVVTPAEEKDMTIPRDFELLFQALEQIRSMS